MFEKGMWAAHLAAAPVSLLERHSWMEREVEIGTGCIVLFAFRPYTASFLGRCVQ